MGLKSVSRYDHDCDWCYFLGRDGRYDMYFCPRHESFIMRYSSEPGDYKTLDRGDILAGRHPKYAAALTAHLINVLRNV